MSLWLFNSKSLRAQPLQWIYNVDRLEVRFTLIFSWYSKNYYEIPLLVSMYVNVAK